MADISDDFMKQMMSKSKDYCAVILRRGPNWNSPDRDKIVWEHGRRNFSLRAEGLLVIVCPVRDDSDISGIGIFNGTLDEIDGVMRSDPGVKEGIFVYEVHACRSFPGDSLPG
jgi:hypothetical protein